MKLKELIVLLHVILIWAGCTESAVEPLSGCTNCNAINFDDDANEDDGSCIFINANRLGDYAVIDSTMDWVFEWWHDEYNISIVRDSCDSMGLKINNYANVSSLDVSADIIGDSILIPYQVVSGYEILETDGYFQEDSIFFQIYYLTPNFGDPYIGFIEGIKTD
ncbi:MAG: hypothetical protein QGI18_06940 [Candidatus Marinimicrobia bacterium]|nr:hypothetical protein [Candidatus Neomarinimicrobiota bacterium]